MTNGENLKHVYIFVRLGQESGRFEKVPFDWHFVLMCKKTMQKIFF